MPILKKVRGWFTYVELIIFYVFKALVAPVSIESSWRVNMVEFECYEEYNAFSLRYSKPYLNWLKKLDKLEGFKRIDYEEERRSSSIYIIPEIIEIKKRKDYVKSICKDLFEHELGFYYRDEKYWPEDRSWKNFVKWFSIEYHDIIYEVKDEKFPQYESDELSKTKIMGIMGKSAKAEHKHETKKHSPKVLPFEVLEIFKMKYIKEIREEYPDILPFEDEENYIDWNEGGFELLKVDKFDEAEILFKKTLVIQPRHHNGPEGLAYVYYYKKEFEKAEYFMRHAINLAREFLKTNSIDIEVIEEIEENLNRILERKPLIMWWK